MTPEDLRELCEKGETGDADSAFEAAEYYYGRREYDKAYTWYEKAVQGENPNPMVYFNLAYACQMGEGTQVDLIAAYDYYEKAAAKHLPQALYQLAYFYQNGLVVKQDFRQAELYSRQAAKELAALVTRLHEAEVREEAATKRSMEILRSLEQMNTEWRAIAEENARLREQLAEESARLREQFAEESARLKEQYAEENAGLKRQFAEESVRLKEQYAEENAGLKRQLAEENVRLKEQLAGENTWLKERLAEAKVRERSWKMGAEEWERKAARLEYENRNMTELLLQAQAELDRRKCEKNL